MISSPALVIASALNPTELAQIQAAQVSFDSSVATDTAVTVPVVPVIPPAPVVPPVA